MILSTPIAPELQSKSSVWTQHVTSELFTNLSYRVTTGKDPLEKMTLYAPFTGEAIGSIPLCKEDAVREALYRAKQAQTSWEETSLRKRKEIFLRFHDLILAHQETLLDILQIEGGKARRHAFEEVMDVAIVARYYAFRAKKYLSPKQREGAFPLITQTTEYHHPVGVVGIISPWNYPLSMAITDAIPAMLAGNSIILKPAEQTSFIALYLQKLLRDAELPADVFQVVTGIGSDIGPTLIAGIDFLHFTGSTATGRIVAQQASANLIKSSLELGGKNPFIVLKDANISEAVSGAIRGCFTNAGQLCISFERMYLHEDIYETFLDQFVQQVQALSLGTAFSHDVEMGSIISEAQLNKIISHVTDAKSKGATVLVGGNTRPDIGPLFYEPTVLTHVNETMILAKEETFGPVVSVYSFSTEAEAIALANDSMYGLNASIWSKNIAKAQQLATKIKCGTVNINDAYAPAWASIDAPMGGMKASGIGRRHGREGMLKYTESQTVSTQYVTPIASPSILNQEQFSDAMHTIVRWIKHIPGIR